MTTVFAAAGGLHKSRTTPAARPRAATMTKELALLPVISLSAWVERARTGPVISLAGLRLRPDSILKTLGVETLGNRRAGEIYHGRLHSISPAPVGPSQYISNRSTMVG